MARRREESHYHRHRHHHHHDHHQLQYASILPITTNDIEYHDPRIARRYIEQDRKKALYVDFENAFQDQTTNHDYFGFQPPESIQQYSQQPTNFHLQSVHTISEVENRNLSPQIRYQASRETSHSSTPTNIPPYQPRYTRRPNPSRLPISASRQLSSAHSRENLVGDFSNLNLIHTNDNNEIPITLASDAVRLKLKQQETIPNSSAHIQLVLPQYFLVKYLGRTPCSQLWGSKAVRTPIDDMVRGARQLSSMNELPTLEACVNTCGFTLTHRQSPERSKRHPSPERYQHGIIPLENISYVMHDIKYSKIAACIVLRQSKISSTDHQSSNETLTECYAFLFQSKEHAHRFTLALAEAFNTQLQSTRSSRQNHDETREGRSPERRSRHRHGYHQDKYDENYSRNSEV